MRLLLDTHIFLWFISGDARLSDGMKESIRSSDNEVFLSIVSLWETIIKNRLGRLLLPEPAESYLPTQRHEISSLSLDEASVSHLAELPAIHRDPFDRMLICQAMEHGLTIVTVDNTIRAYPVSIL